MARVLLIGATGVFGSRLATHLAREPRLTLLLGSRSLARAEAFAQRLAARAETKASSEPVAIDVKSDVAALLGTLAPKIVIDCSGPFQDADFRLPRAALEAGAHFIDLADARRYILDFPQALDALARERGLVALTGASSSPALASAALDAMAGDWHRIDHVAIAIVPGGQSDTGDAAIGAALTYCGKPVPIVRERRLDSVIGWSGGETITVAGLGLRQIAPVETADAELLAARHAGAASIRFRAGLESRLEQGGMRLLALLRRWKLLRRPERLLKLLSLARKLTRPFGRATGGMIVRASGLDRDGRWREATWTLVAADNQGPHVPPSPAAAAIRALLAEPLKPGARACLELPLAAIEREFEPYPIRTATAVWGADRSLLEAVLGPADFARLAPVVAAFHAVDGEVLWAGEARVDGAANPLAHLVARVVGFPRQADSLPVTVVVERESRGDGRPPEETWVRRFGERRFRSRFHMNGQGRAFEQFGPFRFEIGFAVDNAGRLAYPVRSWSIAGLPLPRLLAPRSDTCEWQDEQGRFCFDVGISLPLLGRVVRYRGWLKPVMPAR